MGRRDITKAKTLRVGGITWKILRTKAPEKAKGCIGYCDLENRTIWIKSGLDRQQETRVIVHEMRHAMGADDEAAAGQWEDCAGCLIENGLL